jgi:hypothetical protein
MPLKLLRGLASKQARRELLHRCFREEAPQKT